MTGDAETVLQALRDGGSPQAADELARASGIIGQRFERAVDELVAMGVAERMYETGPSSGYSFSDLRLLSGDD